MTNNQTNNYIQEVQKVFDKGTKEQIEKTIAELKNIVTIHSESIFEYWIMKLERLLNNFDYYCNTSEDFKINHGVKTEEQSTTKTEQFKMFMLEQYGKRRFTEDQIRRTNKEHNSNPTINILTQLAIIAANDGTFTQEEINTFVMV